MDSLNRLYDRRIADNYSPKTFPFHHCKAKQTSPTIAARFLDDWCPKCDTLRPKHRTLESCPHCAQSETYTVHTFVCDCGHSHGNHAYRGGCRFCSCAEYSQKKSRTASDPWVPYVRECRETAEYTVVRLESVSHTQARPFRLARLYARPEPIGKDEKIRAFKSRLDRPPVYTVGKVLVEPSRFEDFATVNRQLADLDSRQRAASPRSRVRIEYDSDKFFVGQGVKHETLGYGVVHYLPDDWESPLCEQSALVLCKDGKHTVRLNQLVTAAPIQRIKRRPVYDGRKTWAVSSFDKTAECACQDKVFVSLRQSSISTTLQRITQTRMLTPLKWGYSNLRAGRLSAGRFNRYERRIAPYGARFWNCDDLSVNLRPAIAFDGQNFGINAGPIMYAPQVPADLASRPLGYVEVTVKGDAAPIDCVMGLPTVRRTNKAWTAFSIIRNAIKEAEPELEKPDNRGMVDKKEGTAKPDSPISYSYIECALRHFRHAPCCLDHVNALNECTEGVNQFGLVLPEPVIFEREQGKPRTICPSSAAWGDEVDDQLMTLHRPGKFPHGRLSGREELSLDWNKLTGGRPYDPQKYFPERFTKDWDSYSNLVELLTDNGVPPFSVQSVRSAFDACVSARTLPARATWESITDRQRNSIVEAAMQVDPQTWERLINKIGNNGDRLSPLLLGALYTDISDYSDFAEELEPSELADEPLNSPTKPPSPLRREILVNRLRAEDGIKNMIWRVGHAYLRGMSKSDIKLSLHSSAGVDAVFEWIEARLGTVYFSQGNCQCQTKQSQKPFEKWQATPEEIRVVVDSLKGQLPRPVALSVTSALSAQRQPASEPCPSLRHGGTL